MKCLKSRAISIVLCILLVLSPQAVCYAAQNYPYVDENGVYHRISDGEEINFNTDYDEMIKYFQNKFLSHETNIDTYYFATKDEEFAYDSDDKDATAQLADTLFEKIFYDIFTKSYTQSKNPALGDYLYHDIDMSSIDYGVNTLLSSDDTPLSGNDRYYTFKVTITNVEYTTTIDEEKYIADFAASFSQQYLADCATDYEKVKTIYDFLVRNVTYDYDVFNEIYSTSSERYRISHSAIGAICGSLVTYSNGSIEDYGFDDFDLTTKDTITNQKVSLYYNQGRAVCDGYSKLFYYLCTFNSIDCRIVEGNYTISSGLGDDGHEWNYVYLDDGLGSRWFEVDATFASQKSYKEIDYNNYDYFLRGTSNENFSAEKHQQPFCSSGENQTVTYSRTLYDWYEQDNIASDSDYTFEQIDFSESDMNLSAKYIICRCAKYSEEENEKYSFVLSDSETYEKIYIDEEGNISKITVNGFEYNSNASTYTISIPYLVGVKNGSSNGEYISQRVTAVQTGEYPITVEGKTDDEYSFVFKIVALDMSDSQNYIISSLQTYASYSGSEKIPHIKIEDGYGNELQNSAYLEDKSLGDYDLVITKDGEPTAIKDMGEYNVVVTYKGNYTGSYSFNFTVGKIDLSELGTSSYSFQYYPERYLKANSINGMDEYIKKSLSSMTVGDVSLSYLEDYDLTVNGTGEYGDESTVTVTPLDTSEYLEPSKEAQVSYSVNEKFDISRFDDTYADSNKTNKYYYTGSEVKPTKFDNLDKYLTQNKDYKIVSYSNNKAVGTGYVTIQGIGGCTGTATLKFVINKAQADTSSYVKPTSKNKISLSFSSAVYDGTVKTPTVKIKNSSGKTVNSYYYKVYYPDGRKKIGTYSVTVKFRNGYSGTFSTSFKIVPKGTSISKLTAGKKSFTVKWKKQSTQTTGYQIQYSTSSKFKNAKTVTVSKNSTTSKTIKKLKAKKKYYVRVRTYKTVKVNGKNTKIYSSWSKAKSVKTK